MSHIRRVQLEDIYEHPAAVTFMRDLKVAIPHRLVGSAFVGATLDTNFWTSAVSGAGAAVSQADHDVTISSGTANSGYAHLQTARPARFVFAHPHIYRAAARIASGNAAVALNTRRWGAGTVTAGAPQDGFYFELSAAGALSIVSCKAGTPTPVASGAWNGPTDAFVMDANLHAYEIHYFVMKAEFYIDGDLVHTLTPTTGNMISDQNLYAFATSVNGASGTTSGALNVHAATIMRIGKEETQPRSVYQAGTVAALVLKRGPGITHTISLSAVANNSVVTLWDNTAASGTTLWSSGSMAAQTQPFQIDLHQVAFYTGLTLSITGAASTVTVVYE
jgi:hypothetical protein